MAASLVLISMYFVAIFCLVSCTIVSTVLHIAAMLMSDVNPWQSGFVGNVSGA
jgi:hypothetical protein